jgi:heme-degrading monooxygenase HmoA
MIVSISIIKYPTKYIPFAFLAMALHRIPLLLNKNCKFWKLMGCGKNGTFDINPDFHKWGLLTVWHNQDDYENFKSNSLVTKWWNLFSIEQFTVLLEPLESHGEWSGKKPFGDAKIKDHTGKIAILTRATIRFNRLKNFWRNVPPVANIMSTANGFITSIGIGEAPYFMQATFSVWENLEDVKNFAYKSKEHAEVIKLTRVENWYKEELFARFRILDSSGSIDGINPINL